MDAALREFLRENWDIFAWHPSDMPGIPRGLAEHILNILKGFKPSSRLFGVSLNLRDKLWERN